MRLLRVERALGSVNVGEHAEAGYSGQAIDKRPFLQQLLARIVERRDMTATRRCA